MLFAFTATMLIAAVIWGDWKNWNQYYSTIQYMVTVALVHAVLTSYYPTWMFHRSILPNHTLINLVITFIQFPALILVYLSHLPRSKVRLVLYMFLWTGIFTLIEVIGLNLGTITYHNGWSLGWSIFLDLLIFPMLYLHHRKPLWAWVLSVPTTVFFVVALRVPVWNLP